MMDEAAVAAEKTALRRKMRAHCRRLVTEKGPEAAAALARCAPAALPDPAGRRIAGYLALDDEIDPLPLLKALAARGAQILLPVVTADDAPLSFHPWTPGAPLRRGRFGTREPETGEPPQDPEWLFVPLRAFDRRGGRLGRGGGLYDRTLTALKPRSVTAIGAAFADQEVDAVPMAAHDARLDAVLTEHGLIVCKR